MRTIIAGSRSVTEYQKVVDAVAASGFGITVVFSGTARGVDVLGERWASDNNIPLQRYPANWGKFGRGAGPIRNAEMVKHADALIAIWDGKSHGTKNIIETAKSAGLKVHVVTVET